MHPFVVAWVFVVTFTVQAVLVMTMLVVWPWYFVLRGLTHLWYTAATA